MKKLHHVLFLFFLFFQTQTFAFEAKVVAIHDGDTIQVETHLASTNHNKKIKVRLLGTDSPEVDFNQKTQGAIALSARDYLRDLLPIGSLVNIETFSSSQMDKHNRILGQIILNGRDLNLAMLEAGWSVVYFIAPYPKDLVQKYSRASELSFLNKRGIFAAQSLPEMPYQFRLRVTGAKGNNLIGDIQTRRLYNPESIEEVPFYRRLFFSSYEAAKTKGFEY